MVSLQYYCLKTYLIIWWFIQKQPIHCSRPSEKSLRIDLYNVWHGNLVLFKCDFIFIVNIAKWILLKDNIFCIQYGTVSNLMKRSKDLLGIGLDWVCTTVSEQTDLTISSSIFMTLSRNQLGGIAIRKGKIPCWAMRARRNHWPLS